MVKIVNKSTKRIRVIQIILFLIQLFLTSTPFIWGGMIDLSKKQSTFTVLDMIMYIGASTGNEADDKTMSIIGVCFLSFIILPLIALCFQLFDRYYNLKNIAGLICSGLGVVCLVYFVGSWLCLGAVVAMLLYLVSFFLSVMGIFARLLKVENTASKEPV